MADNLGPQLEKTNGESFVSRECCFARAWLISIALLFPKDTLKALAFTNIEENAESVNGYSDNYSFHNKKAMCDSSDLVKFR